VVDAIADGGSKILSYQIEIDDGEAGPYTIVLGENVHSLET